MALQRAWPGLPAKVAVVSVAAALLFIGVISESPVWADRLSIGTFGLNVHGFQEQPIYYKNMPRRMDETARFVPTPELFLHYRTDSHQQMVATIGEDCYAQPAAYFSWGMYHPVSKALDYGFIVGAYYRKTHLMQYEGETRNIKEFYTFNIGNGNQFVPMPMATLSLDLPLGKTTGLGISVGSNYFVTHLVAVMTFDMFGLGPRVEGTTTQPGDVRVLNRN